MLPLIFFNSDWSSLLDKHLNITYPSTTMPAGYLPDLNIRTITTTSRIALMVIIAQM